MTRVFSELPLFSCTTMHNCKQSPHENVVVGSHQATFLLLWEEEHKGLNDMMPIVLAISYGSSGVYFPLQEVVCTITYSGEHLPEKCDPSSNGEYWQPT